MLRVIHCIYDDPQNPWVGGGGAMRVLEIYRRLAREVDVTVVTGNFPGARDEVVDGVRYHRLGARTPYPLSRWTYARAASALLARTAYHAGIFDFSVYTPLRLPKNRPVGLVVHMLHGPTARHRWGAAVGGAVRTAERVLLRQTRWISTTSHWMEEQLRPLVLPDTRVVLIRSGVSDVFTRVERREENFLLYYGRFDIFQKGLDTLLDAFALVLGEYPATELRIAGRGKDEAGVRELASARGVGDRVRMFANIEPDGVLTLLAGALALVMPSRLEGLPVVPAEAMAAGVPVVGSNVGAVPEVVDPPNGGILVPADDPRALADAMLLLLRSPELRADVSRSARRSAERFSWDVVAQEHHNFLRSIAEAGASAMSTGIPV